MNRAPKRPTASLAAAPLLLALSGCLGLPDLDTPRPVAAGESPERTQAIAEMRAEAEAGDSMPYPDAFQAVQTSRLATRQEPLTMAEVEAVQTELALIAERRAETKDPREIAALEARARELRRLALKAGAGTVLR